jgi:hypothetical protein
MKKTKKVCQRERERERERRGGLVHEEEGNGFVDLMPKVPLLPSMMEKPRGKTTTSKDQQVHPLLKGEVAGKCQ